MRWTVATARANAWVEYSAYVKNVVILYEEISHPHLVFGSWKHVDFARFPLAILAVVCGREALPDGLHRERTVTVAM